MKSLIVYCVVSKEKPNPTFWNLVHSADRKYVVLKKGEKLIKLEAKLCK